MIPYCIATTAFTSNVISLVVFSQSDEFPPLRGKISKLIRPVIINITMTLLSWYYVYNLKTDDRLSAMFLLDSKTNRTTGNDFQDGMVR
uniref:G_PROTEIN_RECEP_F1_2 domain-containing protein n=1 Tax=Heterorhabditis bacteriophora TaxID=37862 RepID=A0A1I7XGZ2_HETBA